MRRIQWEHESDLQEGRLTMNRMVHVDIQEIVKEENVTHDWRLLMVLEGQIKVAIFQTDYKLVKDNFIIFPSLQFKCNTLTTRP